MNQMKQSSIVSAVEKQLAPLTKWSNEPTLLELKRDLSGSKSIHDTQVLKIQEWLDNMNVTGNAVMKTAAGNSKIVPKLIRRQAEWRYPALSEPFLSTANVFNVKPVSAEDRQSAKQNQILLNNQFNTQIDKIAFIDEYVRTAVDEGTVIVRVGWDFVEEEYEANQPVVEYRVNPGFAPTIEHVARMKQENPSLYNTDVPEELKQAHDLSMERGEPVEPVVTGSEKVTKTKTIKNCPTLDVFDFRNVVMDPTCMGNIRKAQFMICSFESSISELKKKGKRYKNLDQINLENSSILGTPDHAIQGSQQNFNFVDDPRKKIVVYEYWGFWDISGKGKLEPFVASWVGNTMIRMELTPFPDKELPFVVKQYLPVRRNNYGEPDGALLEDNQKVIGAVTRGMIDIMGKSANGQTGIQKGILDVTNRRKYDKGLDYEFNPTADPRSAIYMHTYPEIPASAQWMLQLQNQEAESMSGVKSFSAGVSGASLGDVAAGIRGALDAASKRELGILRRLSSGIVEIGRKMISMNAEFLSDEEVIRVTDEQFVTIRRDDLGGKFDLELSISTAEEDNNKAEQLAFMLQTSGPSMDPSLQKMILGDICTLRKMPDLAKKIESYEPAPDPVAQKMQELEIAKIEAEIADLRAKTQKTLADAGLAEAKAGTEQAKQGQLKSDTDLNNLDFVEQESGVKQERALQHVGEQARSQSQLAVLTDQLKDKDRKNDLLKEYVKAKSVTT